VVLEKSRVGTESSIVAYFMSIALSSSPLPPLSTLIELGKLLGLKWIPDHPIRPSAVDSVLKRRGCSKDFIELYKEAWISTSTGSRENLNFLASRFLDDLREKVESTSWTAGFVLTAVVTVAILFPLVLNLIYAFTAPNAGIRVSVLSMLFVAIGSLITVLLIPQHLHLPLENRILAYALAPLALVAPLYFILHNITVALLITTIPSSLILFKHQKKLLESLKKGENILSVMCTTKDITLAGIRNPRKLLSREFWGFMRYALATLFILLKSGSEKYFDYVSKLSNFVKEYRRLFFSMRRRGLAILAACLFMTALAASMYAISYATLENLSELGYSLGGVMRRSGFEFPTRENLATIRTIIDFSLVTISASLALIAACFRDANPSYTLMYLPVFLLVSALMYNITLNYIAPQLIPKLKVYRL